MIPCTTISKNTYQKWLETGEQIDTKNGYPAVILLPDDTVVKVWAKKPKLLSSNRWNPYSNRFVKHAKALKALKIPVPEILEHGKLEGTHVRLVRYRSVPGRSVRSILHQHPDQLDIPSLAYFYKTLHDLGINFKGGHLGNIIQIGPGEYGLIDFTSLSIFPRPLNERERKKNLARPLSYEKDREALNAAGHPDLMKTYSSLT